MLKSVEESLKKNRMLVQLKSTSPKIFINCARESSSFTVGKPGRHHLNQVVRGNININETVTSHLDSQYDTRRHNSAEFSPKMHNFSLTMTRHQTNTN